jgi:hypothetical protein
MTLLTTMTMWTMPNSCMTPEDNCPKLLDTCMRSLVQYPLIPLSQITSVLIGGSMGLQGRCKACARQFNCAVSLWYCVQQSGLPGQIARPLSPLCLCRSDSRWLVSGLSFSRLPGSADAAASCGLAAWLTAADANTNLFQQPRLCFLRSA